MTLDEQAAALYASRISCHPVWEQLGETTKSVWREYVLAGQTPEWPFPRKPLPIAEKVEPMPVEQEPDDLEMKVTFPPPTKDWGTVVAVSVPAPTKPLTLKERLALKGLA